MLLNKTRISEISKCCTTWLLKSKTNYFCTTLFAIFWGQKWDYEVGLWSLRLSGSIKNHINCFMWYFSVYIIFSSAKWNTRSLCKKSVSDTSDLIVMLFTLIKVNSKLLVPVVCFAELVWAEQHAMCTQLSPKPAS